MHECIWPKRGLAGITRIHEPVCTLTNWDGISRAQLHEKIVWMLPIDQWLAFVSFTCLEEQWRAARRKRERLRTHHAAQLECAWTDASHCCRHEPVRRFKLRHAPWSTLAIDAHGEVVMKHQHPLARLLMQHRHRARVWLPRRTGAHSTHVTKIWKRRVW